MRQQRTNYLRQRPQIGVPDLVNELLWSVGSLSAGGITLFVYGSFEGLVTAGIPALERDDTNALPTSAVWTDPAGPGLHGTLDLTYALPLPTVMSFTLPIRSAAVSNRFGGFLAAAKSAWPNNALAPGSVTAGYYNHAGSTVQIELFNGVQPYCFNSSLVITNATTAELGTPVSLNADQLGVDFPTLGLTSGDTIELVAATDYLIDQTGAQLQPFSFLIP